jgi:hypothetical protein
VKHEVAMAKLSKSSKGERKEKKRGENKIRIFFLKDTKNKYIKTTQDEEKEGSRSFLFTKFRV